MIQRDIYRTIAYFSYFGYPLTVFEVWKWLYKPSAQYTFNDVLHALESMEELQEYEGFFGIETGVWGTVERQVRIRKKRFLNAVEKYRKLRYFLWFLGLIPTIEGVAVCNSLAFLYTRERSDIDLFVIAQPGRIWTTRFLSILPLRLLRQRPKEAWKNPIDISFFVTSNKMNIATLRLEDEEDPYLSYWLRSLVPVVGYDVFDQFVRHNAWAKVDLPNTKLARFAYAFRLKRRFKFPNILPPERWFERLQRRIMPKEIEEMANQDTRVCISDHVLKFHKNDRRREVVEYLHNVMNAYDARNS